MALDDGAGARFERKIRCIKVLVMELLQLLQPVSVRDVLGQTSPERVRDVVDFGCGFGTFALPAARRISGTLHGFDIEAEMVAECERRAQEEGVHTARFYRRDFVAEGTGLAGESVDYAMLFNILHAEEPLMLLREAWRILVPGGLLAITHWNYDSTTPRGPSMEIRPRPEQCREWAEAADFVCESSARIDLPPYHYGWLLRKSSGTRHAGGRA